MADMLTRPQLYDARVSFGASGDNMLHSWTSILVKFHIEISSTVVHMARHPVSNNPEKKEAEQEIYNQYQYENGHVTVY